MYQNSPLQYPIQQPQSELPNTSVKAMKAVFCSLAGLLWLIALCVPAYISIGAYFWMGAILALSIETTLRFMQMNN
jgi:hypothetical protein